MATKTKRRKKTKKTDNDFPRDIVIDCPTQIVRVTDKGGKGRHTRYSLGDPRFFPVTNKRGRWVAATGNAAVVVHVDGDFDKADDVYVVPAEVVPTKKADRTVSLKDGEWTSNGSVTVDAKAEPVDGKPFPDVYPAVFPVNWESYIDKKGEEKNRLSISINTAILRNVALAVNSRDSRNGDAYVVRISIGGPSDSVAVVGDSGIGVIMPLSDDVDGSTESFYRATLTETANHRPGVSDLDDGTMFVRKKEYMEFLRWRKANLELLQLSRAAAAALENLVEHESVSDELAEQAGELSDRLTLAVGDTEETAWKWVEPEAKKPTKTKKKKAKKETPKRSKPYMGYEAPPVEAEAEADAAASAKEDYFDYDE